VTGDPWRLEQIPDNLLSNAVNNSPAGGEIGVSLRQADDGIVFAVSDSGIASTWACLEGDPEAEAFLRRLNMSQIENYLGFPAGLSGEELAARAALHAQSSACA
jgi:hypothetical protein